MSIDVFTSPNHLHYKTILDTLNHESSQISTPLEHDSLMSGSIISTPQGYARKEEKGWRLFGQEGIFPMEGTHQVIRQGWLYLPEKPPVEQGETGVVASYKFRILEHLKKLQDCTYTDFHQLLDLPLGSLISTTENDYQRYEHGWKAPGSEVSTSSQGIVRHREAYLILKA